MNNFSTFLEKGKRDYKRIIFFDKKIKEEQNKIEKKLDRFFDRKECYVFFVNDKKQKMFKCNCCNRSYKENYLDKHLKTKKHISIVNKPLTDIVKEKGIVDIINSYKEQIERIEEKNIFKEYKDIEKRLNLKKEINREIELRNN